MGKTDANKEGMRGGGKKMKRKPGERKKWIYIYMEKVGGDESRI